MAFRSNIKSLELVDGRIVLTGSTAFAVPTAGTAAAMPRDMRSLSVSVALHAPRDVLGDDATEDVVVGGAVVTGKSVRAWTITFAEAPVQPGTKMLVLGAETFVTEATGIGDTLSLMTVTWSEQVTLADASPTGE